MKIVEICFLSGIETVTCNWVKLRAVHVQLYLQIRRRSFFSNSFYIYIIYFSGQNGRSHNALLLAVKMDDLITHFFWRSNWAMTRCTAFGGQNGKLITLFYWRSNWAMTRCNTVGGQTGQEYVVLDWGVGYSD